MKTLLAIVVGASLVTAYIGKQIAVPERATPIRNGEKIEAAAGITPHAFVTDKGLKLHYRVIAPAQRDMYFHFKASATGAKFGFGWNNEARGPLPVRGSIVYLHGWSNSGQAMVPWALAFADRGWRGIAIDLRGHGQSGDAPAGYGPREAADVAQLIAHLQAKGELPAPVFLFGNSYGATTALFAEPALRKHLAGIVALQPFPSAELAVRGFIDMLRSSETTSLTDKLQRKALRGADVDAAITDASKRLGIDLAAVDVRPVVAASRTCLLFVHGEKDQIFPVDGSRAMAASTSMAHLVVLPDQRHTSVPVRVDWLATPLHDWMDATAQRGDAPCPAFMLPPEPPPTGS